MLVLPEINFLHLILPVTLLLLGGWMTPTPSQGPPIPQGGGGMMSYDHDHGRGVGGGPGTWNIYGIFTYIWLIFIGQVSGLKRMGPPFFASASAPLTNEGAAAKAKPKPALPRSPTKWVGFPNAFFLREPNKKHRKHQAIL